MAFQATLLSPPSSTPNFAINLSKSQKCSISSLRHKPFQTIRMKVVSMAESGEPNKANKLSLDIIIAKEKLREAIPTPVKEFPWKKASDKALEHLPRAAKDLFKWSLNALKWAKWPIITVGVLSVLSDFMLLIPQSTGLIIPFGLFSGFLTTYVLNEALQQTLPTSSEEKRFVGLSCFFVVVKLFISAGGMKAVFLRNVANGGFLQALYLWLRRNLSSKNDKEDVDREPEASSA